MKRVGLFLHSHPGYGGAFQYNQSILHALCSFPRDSYEIIVAYFYKEWEQHLQDAPIQTISFAERHGNIQTIGSRLRDENCDLWIFPSQDTFTYQLDVPALGTIHDLMHRYEPEFPEVSEEFEHREWRYKNITHHSKGILVDSEVGKKHVMESYHISENKIFTLPFIPPKYIYDNVKNKNLESSINNLPGKYFFYPAQFWEHKNHIRLIEAVNLLKQEHVRVNLVLTGTYEGDYRTKQFNKLTELIRSYELENQITYLGYVDDEQIPFLYKHARALIMPSCFGPTNIPPLEAFVLGCPVAASKIYGIPDQLQDAALYFDPVSVSEMAHCMKWLWEDDDLCQQLIRKGFERSLAWGELQFQTRLLEIVDNLTGRSS